MTTRDDAATYFLHGLAVASDVPIDAPSAPRGRAPDLEITLARPCPVPDELPPGRLVAESADPTRRLYAITEDGHCTLMRFPGHCDVAIDASYTRMTVSPDPSADPGLVGLLATGGALAAILTLAGRCVLHAAAVDVDGRAIVILGPSGSGKSTLAAALCRDGGRLVSDDVLVVDVDGGSVVCHRGNGTLRLRPGAQLLADHLPPERLTTTVDGRLGACYEPTDATALPVAAVVVPQPTSELRTEVVRGAAAVLALSRGPRVGGWKDPAILERWLADAHAIAARVPVLTATLPPPADLPPRLADRLLPDAVALP